MSYPYESNPWDDNYNATTGAGQQQSTNYGNDAYSQSYGMTQYSETPQYQYQDQGQEPQSELQQQGQDSYQQEPTKAPESGLKRFLRQHVPLLGTIMDTMSSISLPFIDERVQNINRDLLVSKMFYFFFYSAFGSLFPLMGVYFKQLGMNPAQVGILTGVRPFIEIFSAPFWHSLAERFQKSKALLLFSVLSWIIFTYSLAHIRPPASACVAFNDTDYVLYTPYSANDLSNYEVGQTDEAESATQGNNEVFMGTLPEGAGPNKEREGKEGILASEENQNDQRRRRKRRQATYGQLEDDTSDEDDDGFGSSKGVNNNNKNKFVYSFERNNNTDDGYESHVDLDIDLDNDYDDRLVVDPESAKVPPSYPESSFFEMDNSRGDASRDSEELDHQLNKRGARFVRSFGAKDSDYSSGEGEEPESMEESNETQRRHQNGASDEEEEEVSGGGREAKGRAKAGDMESEEENEEGEGGSSGKRDRNSESNSNRKPSTMTGHAAVEADISRDSMARPSKELVGDNKSVNKTKRVYKQRHKTPPTHIVGMSPITVEYAVNYNKDKHSQFVTPMFSTIVYKLDDIKEVFFLLLLLISLGEFFSAPALTLADSATLSYLGDNTDLYGRQRMFGSLSWAITLLLVGMALDSATSIADHPCGPHQRERSYTVCFIIFSLLMACAFLTATQFRFNYPKGGSTEAGRSQAALIAQTTDNNTVVTTTTLDGSAIAETGGGGGGSNIDQIYASTQPRSIFNTAPPINAPPPTLTADGKEKFEFLDKWKSAVFAQRTWEVPEWVNVFRQFQNSLHLTYLFITWFLGCGVGLVFTFLFWHLQDVGGTPTLFGICSVINHISEILAYFFSFNFIKRFGHTRVLSVGLGCNVIRFLYVAFLTNPYYALPFEFVQGITHAACFAACCSYISHVSKPELRTSTQGVMQGLHHGIGRACGTLLGGYMINVVGSRASFCIYGLLSGCVLAGFLYVRKKASEIEEAEFKVDDNEALGGYGAPQGVPSAIPGKMGGQTTSTTATSNITGQDIDYQW